MEVLPGLPTAKTVPLGRKTPGPISAVAGSVSVLIVLPALDHCPVCGS